MKKRKFGKIGWDVSEISLGCWAMGADWGDVSEEDAKLWLSQLDDANREERFGFVNFPVLAVATAI